MDTTFESHKDELLAELNQKVQRALTTAGLQMERNAKIEINHAVYDTEPSPSYTRTGRLRASIVYATATSKGAPGKEAEPGDSEPRGTPEPDAVYVGTNVEYAAPVEFGTSRMRPRPYLAPALTNHTEEYKTIFETELKS